jgi:dTDP-glucose 4,6-dehydratase
MYNISPDAGVSIRDLVSLICSKMGAVFSDCIVEVGERLGSDATYVIDSSNMRNTFNWLPTMSLDAGITECIEWVNNNWDTILTSGELEYAHKP